MHFYALQTLLHHYGDVVSIHLIRANDDEHALHRTNFFASTSALLSLQVNDELHLPRNKLARWLKTVTSLTNLLVECTQSGCVRKQEAARWSGEPFAFKTAQIVTSTPPHNYFHKKLLFHQNSRERIKKKEKRTKFMTAETFQEFFSLFFLLGFDLMGYNFISATSLTRHWHQREENLLINFMKLLQT